MTGVSSGICGEDVGSSAMKPPGDIWSKPERYWDRLEATYVGVKRLIVDPAMDRPRLRLVAISRSIHSADKSERKKEESEKANRKEWVLICMPLRHSLSQFSA